MTIKQGEDINKKFSDLNDSIKILKSIYNDSTIKNANKIEKLYTDWNRELINHKITRSQSDSFKTMYEANKRIYEFREVEFHRERRAQQIFTSIVMFMTVILAIL